MKNCHVLLRWLLAGLWLGGLAQHAQADDQVVIERREVDAPGPLRWDVDRTGWWVKNSRVQKAGYLLVGHGPSKAPLPNGKTLLICLPNFGDSAASFARVWLALARANPDVVVAVPDMNPKYYSYDSIVMNAQPIVLAIIGDTIVRDHVNPRHVILLGYANTAFGAASMILAHPDLYAGFADLSDGNPMYYAQNPGWREKTKNIALFIDRTVGPGINAQTLAFVAAMTRYYGFNVIAELSTRDRGMLSSSYEKTTLRMMSFFEKILAANDQKQATEPVATLAKAPGARPAATPALPVPAMPSGVLVENRPLPQLRGGYVRVTANSVPLAEPTGRTLLVCLHSAADTGTRFANKWADLVRDRPDVVVAVPQSADPTPAGIKALIDTLVASDNVNPKQVFLVGHDQGGAIAADILARESQLFAGYGCIAADLPWEAFTSAWRKNAGQMAVYYAVGTQDEMFKDVYAANVAQFKKAGFTHVLTESPPVDHTLTPEEIKHMMSFFEQAVAPQQQGAPKGKDRMAANK